MNLIAPNTLLGTTITTGTLPVNKINATGSTYDGTKTLYDDGTWKTISSPLNTLTLVADSNLNAGDIVLYKDQGHVNKYISNLGNYEYL